ncbi:hypothetical protein THIOSC13_420008 [uncultured Thiomicrorhabdus sp.]
MCDATAPSQAYTNMVVNYEQTVKQLQANNSILSQDRDHLSETVEDLSAVIESYREEVKVLREALGIMVGHVKEICHVREIPLPVSSITRAEQALKRPTLESIKEVIDSE